jgi:membrane fusion protein (multidrug efflux system)
MTRARTWLLAVGLMGLATACNPAGARSDDEVEETEQRAPVLVEPLVKGSIEASIEASSTIEAEQMVTVHAESTGRIVMLDFEEGDTVAPGKLLAKIKAEGQANTLDRAATSLEKAKRDLDIVERLHKQRVASDDELAQARLAYETASIDVKESRRNVRNTNVFAPFGGTVTERFARKGAFVTAGQQILTITDFDTLVARVYVPEKDLDRIRVGQAALVVGKAARSRRGEGTIVRIAPVVDAATGTVKVTVALPPALAGANGFVPGMYAEVKMTTEKHEGALLVSKRALIREDEEAFVFVARGETAHRVRVVIGLEDGERVEVLEGLDVGDEVIVSGQAGLKDGGLIERVTATGAKVDASASASGSDEVAAAGGP